MEEEILKTIAHINRVDNYSAYVTKEIEALIERTEVLLFQRYQNPTRHKLYGILLSIKEDDIKKRMNGSHATTQTIEQIKRNLELILASMLPVEMLQ